MACAVLETAISEYVSDSGVGDESADSTRGTLLLTQSGAVRGNFQNQQQLASFFSDANFTDITGRT